ncbi:HEXXH motif-containing putative peptide modification protein [Streptomyces sp. 15-116A]|uniref:aKG-HExxH-type peptide beta-hydroxylase n=1 Tax=Streptomyces sp. 15-116A TaxID=2259035 RepID=UPI0021B38A6C|nr:HEXXH motif-containing putative peptide modification protein [Streptomyces sp. 15-116A]MCT7356180.1 HEXXH motif-containing putative peptide modification protein [Streptomyces sp. 15-116A]
MTATTRHRLPLSDLDDLAVGRMAPATAGRIRAVERGRRMLMLRAVVESARTAGADTGSPLSPLTTPLDLLLRVERDHPDVVSGLLDHPGLGIWAVRVLDRLRTSGTEEHGTTPLWQELGYLHHLAAAAALRARFTADIDLPVSGGAVPLPTLGRMALPEDLTAPIRQQVAVLRIPASGPAHLTVADRSLPLPDDPDRADAGWQPLRGVADGTLVLDDSDPYRDFRTAPQPATPLTPAEAARWRSMLQAADAALLRRHPHAAALRATALRVLVPLPEAPRYRPTSASYNEAFGSALMSLHQDTGDLAATLVHEARHSVLNGLLHQLPLCEDEDADPELLFAPWRGDPRPASGLLHGAYSFAGVADFWRVERHALEGAAARLAHFEFALWREAVTDALRTLGDLARLTAPGRRFVAAMTEQAAAWEAEQVPEDIAALARQETADLKAVWRARHTHPDAEGVRLLARAWRQGADPRTLPAVPSEVRTDPRYGPPDPRGELRRAALTEPGALTAHAHGGSYAAGRDPALTAPDVALCEGDAKRAAQGYAQVLAADPHSPSAWVGLGLAFAAIGERAAAHALLHRPELVRAVHRTLSRESEGAPPPGIREVSDWIGRIPAVCGEPVPPL